MERDSETNLQRFVGKLPNLRRKPAGREGDVARADAESPRRVDDLNGAKQVVEVGERFAHAHENDIVDLVATGAFDRGDLIDNFVCAQIARESLHTACATRAAVGTTDLRGDANSAPVRFLPVKRG